MKCSVLLIVLITALSVSSVRGDETSRVPTVSKYRRAVEGTVYDSATGNPIPYVTVQLEGTKRSTLTNDDGHYRILLEDGANTVRYSHIAYYSQTQEFGAEDTSCTRDLSMITSVVDIGSFKVYNRKYDDGQRIIIEAIKRKGEILNRFRDFQYQAYTKVVITDLTKVDTSPERIFLIAESQTTAFWEQPDKYKEIITSRRQTSNISSEANLVSVGEIANFNANRVEFGDYSIVSPGWR